MTPTVFIANSRWRMSHITFVTVDRICLKSEVGEKHCLPTFVCCLSVYSVNTPAKLVKVIPNRSRTTPTGVTLSLDSDHPDVESLVADP